MFSSSYFKTTHFKSSYFGIPSLIGEVWRDSKALGLRVFRKLGFTLEITEEE